MQLLNIMDHVYCQLSSEYCIKKKNIVTTADADMQPASPKHLQITHVIKDQKSNVEMEIGMKT